MISFHENFRFDDRHEPSFLAQRRKARQNVGIGPKTGARWHGFTNMNHSSALGKTRANLSVVGEPLTQTIESLGYFFSWTIRQISRALIHFDAGNHSLFAENLG